MKRTWREWACVCVCFVRTRGIHLRMCIVCVHVHCVCHVHAHVWKAGQEWRQLEVESGWGGVVGVEPVEVRWISTGGGVKWGGVRFGFEPGGGGVR